MVFPVAAGSAIAARMAPDHLRVARTAVTATQVASMPTAANRSSPGSRDQSASSRPDADRDVPHHIRPSYADRATWYSGPLLDEVPVGT